MQKPVCDRRIWLWRRRLTAISPFRVIYVLFHCFLIENSASFTKFPIVFLKINCFVLIRSGNWPFSFKASLPKPLGWSPSVQIVQLPREEKNYWSSTTPNSPQNPLVFTAVSHYAPSVYPVHLKTNKSHTWVSFNNLWCSGYSSRISTNCFTLLKSLINY